MQKGWTWPKEGGCGSQCSGLNLLCSSLLCSAAPFWLRPMCVAVVHQHHICSARSDAALWCADAGCSCAERVLLLEGCQYIHRCMPDCCTDACSCSWLCRHWLCQGWSCMQDSSFCFHLMYHLFNACRIVGRCLKVCHCLTASFTWRPLHIKRCTDHMENSLQRVQGSWADLGSKSLYRENDILVVLSAAS